jgi:PhnB protein
MEKQKLNKSVSAVPKDFHTVTPFLIVDNAAGLIEFIQKAFNGRQNFIMKDEDNKIMHATVTIGDSTIMLCDVMENTPAQSAMLYLYLPDVDTVYKKAIEAKANSFREPKDEFYGDRAGAVKDAWGNVWWIATHIEEVAPAELERRSKQAMSKRKEHEHVHL